MGRNEHMISQYRERLDQTLASHDLSNHTSLAALVQQQLQHGTNGYVQNVLLEKRVMQVSNFIEMLTSVSSTEKQESEWKLKQDTEDCRVMYREGPQGTPFHMLLVEGFVDAPMDVCLCISWESALYNKWWPRSAIPTFKILSCRCLQKIQIGEQISSVRMKLSWPLSDREGLVHYFVFEYLQGDLIIVLVNSVSDLEAVDGISGDSNNDGMADADDMVRIDLVGGFAIQKVTSERSYFRTIMSMDIKLDFVPPSVINFISRQLVGTGFKLYKKTVASVSKGDADFRKALGDPLYSRIREALYSNGAPKGMPEQDKLKNDATLVLPKEYLIDAAQADHKVLAHKSGGESQPARLPIINQEALGEIKKQELDDSFILPEEVVKKTIMKGCEEIRTVEEIRMEINHHPAKKIEEKQHVDRARNVLIRPAVEEALETLENAISFVRDAQLTPSSMFPANYLEVSSVQSMGECMKFSDANCLDGETCTEASNDRHPDEKTSDEMTNSPQHFQPRLTPRDTCTIEVNHHRIAPATPEQSLPVPRDSPRELNHYRIAPASPEKSLPVRHKLVTEALHSFGPMEAKAPILKETIETKKQNSAEANGVLGNSLDVKLRLKMQSCFCGLPLIPRRVKA